MEQTKRIIKTVTHFVKGGDTSDTDLLDSVLHKDFRVASSDFMGVPGVKVIDKEGYLSKIREGVFGGLPREMTIEEIDASGKIAMVKLRLTSAENNFVSYNSLVLDEDGHWKIIHNLAVVAALD